MWCRGDPRGTRGRVPLRAHEGPRAGARSGGADAAPREGDPRAPPAVRVDDVPRHTDRDRPASLVHLAASLDFDDLARACHEAGVKYRTTPRQVEAVLARNAPGSKRLRAIMRGDA